MGYSQQPTSYAQPAQPQPTQYQPYAPPSPTPQQPIYGQQSYPNPYEASDNLPYTMPPLPPQYQGPGQNNYVPAPVKRRTKLKVLFVTMTGILLLGGGSAAAYFGYVLPNQPNRVVQTAIAKLFDKKGNTTLSLHVAVKAQGANALPNLEGSNNAFEMSVNASSDEKSNTRADIGVTVSAFRLTSSVIIRPDDKVLFIKLNELPSLLSLFGSSDPAITSFAHKLDANWVQVDATGLENAGVITKSQGDAANTCFDAYRNMISSNQTAFTTTLYKQYQAHEFVSATKMGKEDINGVATTRYKLEIDQKKALDFLKSEFSSSQTFSKSCGAGANTTLTPDENASIDQAFETVKLENTYIWIDKDHQIEKMTTDVKAGGTVIQTQLSFTGKALDVSRPAQVLLPKDLVSDYKSLISGSGASYLQDLSTQPNLLTL